MNHLVKKFFFFKVDTGQVAGRPSPRGQLDIKPVTYVNDESMLKGFITIIMFKNSSLILIVKSVKKLKIKE